MPTKILHTLQSEKCFLKKKKEVKRKEVKNNMVTRNSSAWVRAERISDKTAAGEIAGLFKGKKELFKHIGNKMYPLSTVRHNSTERAEMFNTYFCSVLGKNPCNGAIIC